MRTLGCHSPEERGRGRVRVRVRVMVRVKVEVAEDRATAPDRVRANLTG